MSNFNEPLDQPPLEKSYGILKTNLIAFLLYTVLFSIKGESQGIMTSWLIAFVHVIILFIIGVFLLLNKGQEDRGGSMILTALLLAGIGFSFCLGTLNSVF